VALAGDNEPAVVCIGALPPGGLARAHDRRKRLRARPPNAKIGVGRWGLKTAVEQNREQLQESGADQMETKLLETQTQLNACVPMLSREEAKATAIGAVAGRRMPAV
jgi:hypothetical protein